MRREVKTQLTAEYRLAMKILVSAGKTEQRLAALLTFCAAEGISLEAIGTRVDLGCQACIEWCKRYPEQDIDGQRNYPGSGKPPEITSEDQAYVMVLACTPLGDRSTQEGTQNLAYACRFPKSTADLVLNEASRKPHKVDCCCGKSQAPEFKERQAPMVGLCLGPSEKALMISVDERSQMQALDRTQQMPPLRPLNAHRFIDTYTHHGTTCLLFALLVYRGTIEGQCVGLYTHEELLSFIKHLYRKYLCNGLHVVQENCSAHKHQEVAERSKKRDHLTINSLTRTFPGSLRLKSGSAFSPAMSCAEACGTLSSRSFNRSFLTQNATTKIRRFR